MADEARWVMHFDGGIISPVNTVGYMVLSVQALNAKIESLEREIAVLKLGWQK